MWAGWIEKSCAVGARPMWTRTGRKLTWEQSVVDPKDEMTLGIKRKRGSTRRKAERVSLAVRSF